jgi:hypothetical protein
MTRSIIRHSRTIIRLFFKLNFMILRYDRPPRFLTEHLFIYLQGMRYNDFVVKLLARLKGLNIICHQSISVESDLLIFRLYRISFLRMILIAHH